MRGLLAGAPSVPDRLKLWLSEPSSEREAFRAELMQRYPACQVQVHSAYKPLVHEVLDQHLPRWRLHPPEEVHLRYPVFPGEHPERFLLEAYPLAGWLTDLGVTFTHAGQATGSYDLVVDGQTERVEISCRTALDATGQPWLRPTGRLDLQLDSAVRSYRFFTDAERCWDTYLGWLRQVAWPAQPPFFSVLRVTAGISEPDDALPYGLEASSMTEGLSEELYFGTLDFFQHRAGVAQGSRDLQLGQMIPVVHSRPGCPASLRIEVLPPQRANTSLVTPLPPSLESLDRPLWSGEIRACLEDLQEPLLEVLSVQGRAVTACCRVGEGRGVLVTAGQHANESTGVVAALRALQTLTSPLPLGFIPLENPDGYALFEELRAVAPQHMHHAARYTALGDDLGYRQRPPFFETEIRRELFERLDPVLHLNLHGYPSHEWTRPFSGYLPRGFEAWTLPKGFVLILRYRSAWAQQARELAQALADDLQQNAALMALNEYQLQVYEQQTSVRPYELIQGTPFVFAEDADLACPLTVITEYPDETITGPAFLLGQSAQYQVIGSATRWAESQVRAAHDRL